MSKNDKPVKGVRKFLGKSFQRAADYLCEKRPHQADKIAEEILTKQNYHSWKLAGKVAMYATLDLVDGKFARWAARLEKRDTTFEGARADDLADKKWTHKILGAIASRALMDGEVAYGGFLAYKKKKVQERDEKVGEKRDEAQALGIDPRAKSSGKDKTLKQNETLIFMVSPLAKSFLGKVVAAGLQHNATKLSEQSGAEIIETLDQRIDEVQTAQETQEHFNFSIDDLAEAEAVA